MTDMNGHEDAISRPRHDDSGIHAYPIDGPTEDGLTKQQLLILQHLQRGESITPWIAKGRYHCESLSGVVYALRKKGWDINTNRRTDKNGKKFPSYRLWSQFQRVEQDAVPGPLFDNGSEDPVPEVECQITEAEEDQIGKQTNAEIIKDHLFAHKIISPETAMDVYGIQAGSLRAIISTLRGEKHKLSIRTVKIPYGDAQYELMDTPDEADTQDQDLPSENKTECAMETDIAPETPTPPEDQKLVSELKLVPIRSVFATITGVRRSKDGIELGLAVDGDPDDKPFYKLKESDAGFVLTMLKHFLEDH